VFFLSFYFEIEMKIITTRMGALSTTSWQESGTSQAGSLFYFAVDDLDHRIVYVPELAASVSL